MFFQRNCVRSQANYRLQDDGSVAVTNRCETEDGEQQEARGEAVPQQQGKTDKLWVRFDNWFSNIFPGCKKLCNTIWFRFSYSNSCFNSGALLPKFFSLLS